MSYSENASPITSSGYAKRSPIYKAISDSDDDKSFESPSSTDSTVSPRSSVSTGSPRSSVSTGSKSGKKVMIGGVKEVKQSEEDDGYEDYVKHVMERNDIYDTEFSTIDNFFETLVEFEKMVVEIGITVPKMWKSKIIDFVQDKSEYLPKSLQKKVVDEIDSDFLTKLRENIISKIVTQNILANLDKNLDKDKRNKFLIFLYNLRKKSSDDKPDKPLNETKIESLRSSCKSLMEEVIRKINQGIRGSNDKDIVGKIVTYIKDNIKPTKPVNKEQLKNNFFDTFRDLLNSSNVGLSFGKSRRRRSLRRRKSKTKSTRRRRRSVRRKKSKHSMKKFSSFKL